MPPGDPDNGGLFIPGGFEALVVVDSLGPARNWGYRHLAVNSNGDIYVKQMGALTPGNIGLRDTNGDGKADSLVYFGDYGVETDYGATEMTIYNNYLYYSTAGTVYRNKLTPGKLIPESKTEIILSHDYKNDIHGWEHTAKPLTFDDSGNMYVPFGAPGDVCATKNRIPGYPGQDPCPQLQEHAGIWRFDANKIGQDQKDGERYATGLRSVVAMDWNHEDNTLYVLQHGRDRFQNSWPKLYDALQNAILPSEEFFRIKKGADAGWPYYYYDQVQGKKLLNPEYGGDGKKAGNGALYEQPIIGFPGHWGPNDLLFYTGNQFPKHYKNGAFIAFHGSGTGPPYPQTGYFVCFVPFKDGMPSGPWEVFADGFAGVDTIVNTGDAVYRPMGLAMGPDGSLYISDSEKGRIWRIMYKGDKNKFGTAQLAEMEKRKTRTNIKKLDKVKDYLGWGNTDTGEKIYNLNCGTCHQGDGKGNGNRVPPLKGSEWVTGDKNRLIEVVLKGLNAPITVNGRSYNGEMPGHSNLSDLDISRILNYIRFFAFDNNASSVVSTEVAEVRKALNLKPDEKPPVKAARDLANPSLTKKQAPSVYKVSKLTRKMQIDGNWNKAQWRAVNPVRLTHYLGALPAFKPEVEAKMMYDDANVYVIFRVKDRYVRSVVQEYNGPVSTDACVEFFFSPDSALPESYFNLEINAGGTPLLFYTARPGAPFTKLEPDDIKKIKIAHSLPAVVDTEITEPVTWTIEYQVPLSLLGKFSNVSRPKPGVIWKANFYKNASKSSNSHRITWSPVNSPTPNFHLPEFFGTLKFQ